MRRYGSLSCENVRMACARTAGLGSLSHSFFHRVGEVHQRKTAITITSSVMAANAPRIQKLFFVGCVVKRVSIRWPDVRRRAPFPTRSWCGGSLFVSTWKTACSAAGERRCVSSTCARPTPRRAYAATLAKGAVVCGSALLLSLRGAVEIVVVVAGPVARQGLRRSRKLQQAGPRAFTRRCRLFLEAHFHTRAFGEPKTIG